MTCLGILHASYPNDNIMLRFQGDTESMAWYPKRRGHQRISCGWDVATCSTILLECPFDTSRIREWSRKIDTRFLLASGSTQTTVELVRTELRRRCIMKNGQNDAFIALMKKFPKYLVLHRSDASSTSFGSSSHASTIPPPFWDSNLGDDKKPSDT